MALSFTDRSRRGFLAALTGLGALLCRPPSFAAGSSDEAIQYNGHNLRWQINNGSFQLDDVVLRQDPDTLITAASGEANGLATPDNVDNSRWTLTSKVHIEHEGTVLDADAAVIVFANRRIKSIDVHGSPALFSHPTKNAGQPFQGRAETIAFDGQKRQVKFSGHPWYQLGPCEGTADTPLVYDIDSSVLSSENGGSGTLDIHGSCNHKTNVPPPRTPDRSNAQ